MFRTLAYLFSVDCQKIIKINIKIQKNATTAYAGMLYLFIVVNLLLFFTFAISNKKRRKYNK